MPKTNNKTFTHAPYDLNSLTAITEVAAKYEKLRQQRKIDSYLISRAYDSTGGAGVSKTEMILWSRDPATLFEVAPGDTGKDLILVK